MPEAPSALAPEAKVKQSGPTVAQPRPSELKAAQPTLSAELLGKIVWLLQQSPGHKHLFLADLEWFLMPAIALNQFRVIQDGKQPVALVLWASVSEEVDAALVGGRTRLKPTEWNSGDRLWIVELVAPSLRGDAQAVKSILRTICDSCFSDRSAKMRAGGDGPNGPRIMEIGKRNAVGQDTGAE